MYASFCCFMWLEVTFVQKEVLLAVTFCCGDNNSKRQHPGTAGSLFGTEMSIIANRHKSKHYSVAASCSSCVEP